MPHPLPRGLGHFLTTKNPRAPPPTTGFGTFFEHKKTSCPTCYYGICDILWDVFLAIWAPSLNRPGRFRIFNTNSIKSTSPKSLEHFFNFKKPSCPTPHHEVWDIFWPQKTSCPTPTTGLGTFFELKKTFAYTLLQRGLGHLLNIKNIVSHPYHEVWDIFWTQKTLVSHPYHRVWGIFWT